MLDIAIGLIFVYLLFSLICSAISEIFAWATDLRARTLRGGVETLLDDAKLREFLAQKQLLAGEFVKGLLNKTRETNVASTLYEHPLIQSLRQKDKHPSYLSKDIFASAFLDLLRQAAPASADAKDPLARLRSTIDALPKDSTIRRSLEAVLDETVRDFDHAKARVEKWFDDAMDRVSGWYKRRSQWVVIATSLVLVTAANADTLMIAKALSRDSVLRQSLVAAAQQTVSQGLPEQRAQPDVKAALTQLRDVQQRMDDLLLPVGWTLERRPQGVVAPGPAEGQGGAQLSALEDLRAMPTTGTGWLGKIGGLLFTVFAVSLGAPFWFDTLNKVVNVRLTGKQPDVAPAKAPGRQSAADASGS